MSDATINPNQNNETEESQEIREPRYWRRNGWIARVIKNEDDEGWAVEITKEGESEPALISPWVMGRDKKNPKPIDAGAFQTFVKTATEVIRRAQQQRERMLHKNVSIYHEGDLLKIVLDIVPDENDPHAFLSAIDPGGSVTAKVRVTPNFKLTITNAEKWAKGGFKEP